jgi:hypothetical protein
VTSFLTTDLNTGAQLVVNLTGPDSAFAHGYVARGVRNGVAFTVGEGTYPVQSTFMPELAKLGANEGIWGLQLSRFIRECTCSN